MNTKQKKTLIRIAVALALFVVIYLLPLDDWFTEPYALYAEFALFLVPYLIAGYDVLFKAARNIGHGQVFDENFLMSIATIGAFALVLFPDTDPAYEGADSLKLLGEVAALVRSSGYRIIDIDCVIAAQAPKLSPYRDRMRENIARACALDIDDVGIKATTTEHLGYEGREEGISAQAVALVARCC